MVETDAESGVTPMAHGWGEQRVSRPTRPHPSRPGARHPVSCPRGDGRCELSYLMRLEPLKMRLDRRKAPKCRDSRNNAKFRVQLSRMKYCQKPTQSQHYGYQ